SLWDISPGIPTTPVAILAVIGAGIYAYLGLRALPAPPPAVAVLPTLAVALGAVVLADPSSLRGAAKDLWHGYPVPPQSTVPAPLITSAPPSGGSRGGRPDHPRPSGRGPSPEVSAAPARGVRPRAGPPSRPAPRRSQVAAFLRPSTPQSVRD